MIAQTIAAAPTGADAATPTAGRGGRSEPAKGIAEGEFAAALLAVMAPVDRATIATGAADDAAGTVTAAGAASGAAAAGPAGPPVPPPGEAGGPPPPQATIQAAAAEAGAFRAVLNADQLGVTNAAATTAPALAESPVGEAGPDAEGATPGGTASGHGTAGGGQHPETRTATGRDGGAATTTATGTGSGNVGSRADGTAEPQLADAGTADMPAPDAAADTGPEAPLPARADAGRPTEAMPSLQVGSAAAPGTPGAGAAQSAAAAARVATAVAVPPDQVAVHIAKAAAGGADRLEIHLHPSTLGRIDVELDVGDDGRVEVVVRADRAETLDLLQRDARQLVRALQDGGLRTDNGSLSFELRDGGGEQAFRQQDQHGRREGGAAHGRTGAEPGVDPLAHVLRAAAARGGIDLTI